MSVTQTRLEWESNALQKFDNMIRRIPLFHREIAHQVVEKKAEQNAVMRNSNVVEELDIVKAFLSEVPFAFHSLMIRLMDEVGFNYREYEDK